MVSKSQYGEREVNACKAVLLELAHLLGEIKDDVVIIGGWTPTFLVPQSDDPHVGSLDIDVALNFSKIPDHTYQTILKAFLKRGYVQDKEQPFSSLLKKQLFVRLIKNVQMQGARNPEE